MNGNVLKRRTALLLSDTSDPALLMLQTGGFQSQVNVQPAPAVEGDFASSNPRTTLDVGPGGLVAGASGVTVGRFAWTVPPTDPEGTNILANNFGSGNVAGFVHREQQGLITVYLQDATMQVPQGFQVVLHTHGDFWVKNAGTTAANVGQKAFALYATGQAIFGAAGSTPSQATVTGSIGSQVATFNGSIAGDVLTVNNVAAGTLVAGMIITGGTGLLANTQIISQLGGTVGGAGTYLVNYPEQTVSSPNFSGTVGLFTVTGVTSGVVGVGDVLTGTGITSGTFITALGTGTGGLGTYYISPSQGPLGPETITANLAQETKWYAASNGLPGELVKITSWVGAFG